jgi:hypothetical protein
MAGFAYVWRREMTFHHEEKCGVSNLSSLMSAKRRGSRQCLSWAWHSMFRSFRHAAMRGGRLDQFRHSGRKAKPNWLIPFNTWTGQIACHIGAALQK